MTGKQDQLDIEHWKLETRSGFLGFQRKGEPAPGIAALPSLRNRATCTVITVGCFAYLWFFGDRGISGAAIAIGLYFYLTVDRWKDLQISSLATIQLFGLIFWADHHASPLALFGLVAPAVFLCIAPPGIGATWPRFELKRIGRTGFILYMVPVFVLMATLYWPALNRVLAQAWSLMAEPVDQVRPVTAITMAFVIVFVFADRRLRDIGATWKWWYASLVGLLMIRGFAQIMSESLGTLAVFDLVLAAVILALCFWPSRPHTDAAADA